MSPYVWSSDKPVTPGHYWHRFDEDHEPEIVRFFFDEEDGGAPSLRTGPYPDDVNYLENFHGQWAGPIRRPAEPLSSDWE